MAKPKGSVTGDVEQSGEGLLLQETQCKNCIWRNKAQPMTCVAFPNGIPYVILRNQFDHRRPHPDDGGVQFAPIDPEKRHPLAEF